MTREEFDALDKEQQSEIINVLLAGTTVCANGTEEEEPKGTWMHFKPSYNFQTVEFDMFVTDDNLEAVEAELQKAVRLMMATAPEQPEQAKKSKGPKATKKQLDLLERLHIMYNQDITAKEASQLIDEAFGK